MTDLPPLGFVRALTFEEMSPEQRAAYGPRRNAPLLAQCECEYDILQKFDEEISEAWHREKP